MNDLIMFHNNSMSQLFPSIKEEQTCQVRLRTHSHQHPTLGPVTRYQYRAVPCVSPFVNALSWQAFGAWEDGSKKPRNKVIWQRQFHSPTYTPGLSTPLIKKIKILNLIITLLFKYAIFVINDKISLVIHHDVFQMCSRLEKSILTFEIMYYIRGQQI